MRILIVTPAGKGSRLGNRITALRQAALLRRLGHQVRVRAEYDSWPCDVLFALHASKSAAAIRRSRREAPGRPIVLILTGTDIYPPGDLEPATREALQIADALVMLQSRMLERIPDELRGKAHLIVQSARPPARPRPPDPDFFDVCVIAHLRPVKDPLLTARAARRLPASSRIRVLQVGSALDDAAREEASREERMNPRFHWLGAQPHPETLAILSGSRLLSLTSKSEGGPAVISEALACRLPILATRIPATEGLLGDDHPGLFPVGDEHALASLLERCEGEPSFLAALRRRSEALSAGVTPEREADELAKLLAAVSGDRGG